MATIDELDFKVILHDEDFDKRVKASIKKAQDLNTQLSKLLEIERKVGKAQITGAKEVIESEKALKAMAQRRNEEEKTAITTMKRQQMERTISEELARQALGMNGVAKGADDAAKAHGKSRTNVESTNRSLAQSSNILRQLSTMAGAYFSVHGARRFLSSLIDITGQFEVQKMALTSMLQSGDMADKIFNQYRQLALQSPYTFQDFTKFGKQLTAFNIPAQELVGTTKMLADVAAGLGVDMGRVILAYGQIKSAGVLKGTELRQLTEAGVPILDSLAKQIEETTGKTVKLAEVFSMISKKQIPFEMVEQAFKDMTREGGKFYNMQEVLVETLQGKIGKLRDTWQQMLYDMGSGGDMNRILKGSVDAVTFLVRNFETLGKVIAPIIAGFGAYGAALAVVAIRQKALQLANFASMLFKAATGSRAAAAAITLMGNAGKIAAASFGAISAAAVAIIAIARAASQSRRELDNFKKSLDDVHKASVENNSYDKEISELTLLRKILNDTTSSYDARSKALADIQKIVPSYHAELTEEGKLINNNKKALDKYIESLKLEAKVKGAKDELAELYKLQREQEKEVKRLQEARDAAPLPGQTGIGTSITGATFDYSSQYRDKLNRDLGIAEAKLTEINKRIVPLEEELKTTLGETGDELDTTISTRIPDLLAGIHKIKSEIAGLRKKASKIGLSENEVKKLESLTAELEVEKKKYELLVGKSPGNGNVEDDRIKGIKREIDLLNKYYTYYQILEPFLGEETASKMKELFGDERDYSTLDEQIDKLINDMKGLGEEGRKAAEEIEASLGRDVVSRLVKKLTNERKAAEEAEAALQKYLDTMQKWADADKSREGTGVAYKLSKAISDYHTATAAADRQYNKAMGEADKAGKKNVVEIVKASLLAGRDKAGALATLKNTVSSLVDDIFKEGMQGFDLTNWNDKTLQQILDIRDAIKNLDIPDNMKNELSEIDGLLEIVIAAFQKYKQEVLEQTVNPEAEKKFVSAFEKVASYLSRAASSMKELAIASGNTELEDLANATGMVAQNLSAAAAGFQMTGSWIGAVIGGGLDLIEQTITAIAKAKTEARQIRDEIRDIQREAAMSKAQSLFGSSVFGEGYNPEAVIGKLTELEKSIQKTNSGYLFRTKKGGLFNAEETKSIARFAAEAKMDLWDEYGNLNAELISHILSTYKDTLTEEQTNWLKDAQSYSEQYMAIMDGIKDKVESIFGDIADSASEKIVDQWVNAGNAALDYADILDDVARSYAKMLIKSAILDDVLNKEEADKVVEMFKGGSYEDAMATIAGDMQRIADMQPVYEQILESFEPYFNREGGDSDNLANGIKGITEDTANLLASYLNAVRADVSGLRMLAETGWKDVSSILVACNMMNTLPTLNDYMAQVAASNANIESHTYQILRNLEAVTTSSTGRRAIAVDVQ